MRISKDFAGMRRYLELAWEGSKRENDYWFIVCGPEGVSKSTFVFHCKKVLEGLSARRIPVANVTRSLSEFIDKLPDLKRQDFICLDEGTEIASDRTLERQGKALRSAATKLRKKSLFVFICFTNPARIQKYFNEDRVKLICFIRKRGVVWIYNRRTFSRILTVVMKGQVKDYYSFYNHPPNVIAHYDKYTGADWTEYEKRKDEDIDKTLKDLKSEYGTRSKTDRLSITSAAKELGVTKNWLTKKLLSGDIPYEKSISGRMYIDKEKLLVLKGGKDAE